jgi:hypothetical protein
MFRVASGNRGRWAVAPITRSATPIAPWFRRNRVAAAAWRCPEPRLSTQSGSVGGSADGGEEAR